MQAIILAAGKSTRCYPLTLTCPKPLLPIANRPLIFYNLDVLVGLVKEVIIVVGYQADMVKQAIGDKYRNISITYFEQKGMRGTGDAVKQLAPFVKEKFILMNGDDLYSKEDIKALVGKEDCVLVSKVDQPQFFGIIDSIGKRLKGIIEKPSHPRCNLANTAAYVFKPEIIGCVKSLRPSLRGELEFTDAVNSYAKKNEVTYLTAKGLWLPISHSWKLLDANAAVLGKLPSKIEGTVEPGVTNHGKLILGKGSVVKAGAYIEGDVLVGENSVIGPNCYIRGSTTIGNNTKIKNCAEIKNSIIMNGVNGCHFCYIGDSILGNNVNLGAGTKTANWRHDNANIKSIINGTLVDTGRRKLGAIIGDNVHTGINTSIYPGRKLWPGTTTLPGEIVKVDVVK